MTFMGVVRTVSDVRVQEGLRKKGSPIGMREIMGKAVDPHYYDSLKKFTELLSAGLTKALADKGAEDREGVMVFNETGRKYDKILVSRIVAGAERPEKAEVRFFVDRDTGAIYGPKSPQAPNEKRYFGTVYSAKQWNWSLESPEPLNEEKAGVVKVRGYGNVSHYEPVKAVAKVG